MRPNRNYIPGRLYVITQRGNQGQWVYCDDADFETAVDLMRRYAPQHQVAIHGWSLLHTHGHWIFEAATPTGISNLMRDMQARYSHYLNTKYRDKPWVLIAPLFGARNCDQFSPHLRTGPVNWTPRYHAKVIGEHELPSLLRHLENNPARLGMARRAVDWPWSSAKAHTIGHDRASVLTFDRWLHLFDKPETMAADWQAYLEDRIRANYPSRSHEPSPGTGSQRNRPRLELSCFTAVPDS